MGFFKDWRAAWFAGAALMFAALPLGAGPDTAGKFDAMLNMAISQPDGAARLARMTSSEEGKTKVLVKVTDDGSKADSFLKSCGGKILSRHGKILSVSIPSGSLYDLACLSSVERIEPSLPLTNNNDLTAGETGINLASVLETNPAYDGSGVVIGIIDSGVDATNPAFRDASGNSRIDYFWTQSVEDASRYPTVVTPEGETRTYEYGSEWTATDFGKDIESRDWYDPDGHGTHVAGTAGGRDDEYPGMAPNARFIVVQYSDPEDLWSGAGSGSTLDAYEYIMSRAAEMGMPCVINLSSGAAMGPHDGSTLFEQALQADIESAERKLITCISAGNMGMDNKAAFVTIQPGESVAVPIEMDVFGEGGQTQPEKTLYNSIDIWASNNQEIDFNLADNGQGGSVDIKYSDPAVETYEINTTLSATVSKELPSSLNGNNRFLINMIEPDLEPDYHQVNDLTLTITNNSSEEEQVQLYLQRNTYSCFDNYTEGACSLTMPGTTPGAITVGAYVTRPTWADVDGNINSYPSDDTPIGVIAPFSSVGPTRAQKLYTGLNATKPDICAPGCNIISQGSSNASYATAQIFSDGKHVVLQGTSMSAPVVTGTVALLLQENPDATAADIKEALFDAVRSDDSTGELPNNVFGNGKLDASAVLSDKLVSPQPEVLGASSVPGSPDDLSVIGRNFAVSCEAYINKSTEPWPKEKTEYISSSEIILHGVYAQTGTIIANKADVNAKVGSGMVVYEVKVVNPRGAVGKNSSGDVTVRQRPDTSGVTPIDSPSGSGCFIATAAYGSYLSPEVMQLRRFRDRSLMTNAPGRKFVELYYTYSPSVANYIAVHPSARFATRVALTPVVFAVVHPAQFMALIAVFGLGAYAWRRRRAA